MLSLYFNHYAIILKLYNDNSMSKFVSALAGISMLICALLINDSFLVTIMAMTGRFFITYSMNTAAQISLEVVPTQLRGQGTALANVCAMMSNFFAPQIVYSTVLDQRAPFLILGFGGLLASILAVFLPETAGVKLPDTIREAEETMKCPNLCDIPCISKSESSSETNGEKCIPSEV